MPKKKKQIPVRVSKSEAQVKDFFDMLAPGAIKFNVDHVICGDTFRSIWAIREYTKPLFSIPTHQFLFNAGNINPREFMDALQIEESEFDLIKFPERGVCLFKCGNERYLLQVIAPEYKSALFGKAGGR